MKQRFTKLPGSTHVLSLFFALILSVWGTNPAWADEITVYDGTATNSYLPLYGYYADSKGTISEFIVPSSQLTALNGMAIKQLTFYLSQPANASFGNASFNVYLEEVTGSNYDDSSGSQLTESKTLVYAGALDATGSTMEIPFTNNYTYKGGNLLIAIEVGTAGTYKAATFYGTTTTSYAGRYKYSSNTTRAKFIPKTTFITPTNGPALTVKDGSTKITSPYAFDFGLATAGTTKTFTLSNPGTAAVEGLSVSETGNFGATLSATSIAAGGEATLTITMPAATGSSAITISSTTEGIADFVINANGTVRDNEKIYIDFDENALPATWTLESGWSVNSTSHVATIGGTQAYIRTPEIISEGESLMIQYKGNGTISWYSYSGYSPVLIVYTSTDNSSWDEGQSVTISDNDLHTASFTIPSSAKYIAIAGKYLDIDYIYGCKEVAKPLMVVTQPASLSYSAITENTSKTFTIANTGLATLEGITVTSSNSSIFTVSGAPTSLAAGASQEVTITMSAAAVGNHSSDITVSATGMENVVFTVSGTVLPTGLSVIDFNDNQLPARWENSSTSSYSSGWTFADGAAYTSYYTCTMTTPKILVNAGDMFVVKAKLGSNSSSYYVTINGSSDNGKTWTAYTKQLSNDVLGTDYTYVLLSDIPATVNRLQFVGYYAYIDEIQGINYAPELTVTTGDPAETVSTPAAYNFGECAANASVTYNFANTGAGTINITGVAITGDGAAAYSTSWTESVAAPFALTITRTYDAARAGAAQDATVTVTTSEGAFVINVTGTDKAANAPELAVTLGGEAVATGAAADFGSKLQAAPAAKTYTITNSGTGTLTGTIATSDDSQFTVSKTSFSLGAAESTTFDLALVFNTTYGAKAATITIHPTVGGLEDIVINATASTLDPEAWTEDFEGGTLPDFWTTTGWTITNSPASYATIDNYVAYAGTSSSTITITTPRLQAKKDDVLSFQIGGGTDSTDKLTVEYSNDLNNWTAIEGSPFTSSGIKTFTAPADGYYYLKFNGKYASLDNFEGFKLAIPDHIMNITASSIPSSSLKEGESFDATVTVKENRGVAETGVVAKLYMGTTVIGTSASTDFEANESKVITIPCTPSAGADDVEMHIEVEYTGGTLSTEAVTRDVASITYLTLDETSSDAVVAGTYDHVTLKRKLNAGWNTVCLPFDVADVETVFGTDAKAYNFTSYSGGELGFTSVTTLTASYPYIVYVPAAITDDFALTDITIASGDASAWYRYQGGAYFRGTYTPIAADNWTKNAETDNIYGVTSEGKIAKAGATASIKGFRAYFDLPAGVGAPTAVFEDATTGIKTMVNAGELQLNGEVYNLSGQKVQNAKKGLYIVNGRKVVVK